jgi:8-oxo-dGTP pyrophosphatase MutT (NUDIX family)
MSNPEERFTLRAAAYLLLIRDNKILLSRRYNTAWRNGDYSLIAGHLDPGESIRTTMVREAQEEAGIVIIKENLHLVHVMQQYENAEYFDFYFTAEEWEGEPRNCEPEKCDDMRWFPLNDLPDNLVPNVRQALQAYKAGEFYSEYGLN